MGNREFHERSPSVQRRPTPLYLHCKCIKIIEDRAKYNLPTAYFSGSELGSWINITGPGITGLFEPGKEYRIIIEEVRKDNGS